MRLLLRRDARGKILQRHELIAGVVGLGDEVGVHLRGIRRARGELVVVFQAAAP